MLITAKKATKKMAAKFLKPKRTLVIRIFLFYRCAFFTCHRLTKKIPATKYKLDGLFSYVID